MKQQIERLLNGQATPEEEQQIARLLREGENVEQWLTENETVEYDRIVNQRRAKGRYLRWAVAAVIVAVVMAGAVVLWPKEQVSDTVVEQKMESHQSDRLHDCDLQSSQKPVPLMTAKPKVSHPKAKKRFKQKTTVSTADSLQYYIARLEKELENVNESTYAAKAEEVLRADAHLQRLVQRIMIGELAKDDVPAEAMNTNKAMEEQP